MRVVIAILCVFSLVLVACGDDDDDASLETFCEKNEELNEINAQIFAPPMDKAPEEVEALATEGVSVFEELEAAAPDEARPMMNQLAPFTDFAEILEANGWEVEASGPEIDALMAEVDSSAVDEYLAYVEANCTTETESEG